MTIPFSSIPQGVRVPLVYMELDSTLANTEQPGAKPTVIAGQYLTLGSGYSADTPYRLRSAGEFGAAFGFGSMIHREAVAYFAQDRTGEVWGIGTADAGGGAQAVGTYTITGTCTTAGTLHLRIAGQDLEIACPVTTTADQLGALVAAALPTHASAPGSYPVSASNLAGVLTVTAKHKGLCGNDIKIEVNPLGSAGGQYLPAGITWAATLPMGQATPGTTNPTTTTLLTAISSMDWGTLVWPWTDSTNMTAVEALLNARWAYNIKLRGHAFVARQATLAQAQTYLSTRNSEHVSMIDLEGNDTVFSPKVGVPSYEWAAVAAGLIARAARVHPVDGCNASRTGVLADYETGFFAAAPPIADRRSWTDRNASFGYGGSPLAYARDGSVYLDRCVTTSTTVGGVASNAYRDVQTLYTLDYLLESWDNRLASRFLGERYNSTTVRRVKGECVAWYGEMVEGEYAEELDAFAAGLIVERDGTDPTRLNIMGSPDLVNQLYILAVRVAFRLLAA